MVIVRKVDRRSAVLTPSSLACLSQIPTVNLTMGCAHGCLYCYTRGYRAYPGEGRVDVFVNTLEKLQDELRRKRHKPAVVYFSPASDIFQPVSDVLDLAYDVIHHLFTHGIGIAFLTKGIIPEKHMSLMLAHPGLVRAQIGMISADDALLRTFEPGAAPVSTRTEQMKRLVKGEVKTQLRIDPILPAVTDDADAFETLCGLATECGVHRLACSVLFLRPAPLCRLSAAAKASPLVAKCLAQFQSAHRIAIHAEHSSVVALAATERQAIFQRLEEIAARHGISVKRCACKNPDIATGTCSIAGDRQRRTPSHQTDLFNHPEAPETW
jgi:DNA repair photolyase